MRRIEGRLWIPVIAGAAVILLLVGVPANFEEAAPLCTGAGEFSPFHSSNCCSGLLPAVEVNGFRCVPPALPWSETLEYMGAIPVLGIDDNLAPAAGGVSGFIDIRFELTKPQESSASGLSYVLYRRQYSAGNWTPWSVAALIQPRLTSGALVFDVFDSSGSYELRTTGSFPDNGVRSLTYRERSAVFGAGYAYELILFDSEQPIAGSGVVFAGAASPADFAGPLSAPASSAGATNAVEPQAARSWTQSYADYSTANSAGEAVATSTPTAGASSTAAPTAQVTPPAAVQPTTPAGACTQVQIQCVPNEKYDKVATITAYPADCLISMRASDCAAFGFQTAAYSMSALQSMDCGAADIPANDSSFLSKWAAFCCSVKHELDHILKFPVYKDKCSSHRSWKACMEQDASAVAFSCLSTVAGKLCPADAVNCKEVCFSAQLAWIASFWDTCVCATAQAGTVFGVQQCDACITQAANNANATWQKMGQTIAPGCPAAANTQLSQWTSVYTSIAKPANPTDSDHSCASYYDPTPTPSPASTGTPSAGSTPTPTSSPAPGWTATPAPSGTATAGATPTITPTPSLAASPMPTQTSAYSAAPTTAGSPSASATPSPTPPVTATAPAVTAWPTHTPASTATALPTATFTLVSTATAVPTPTFTPSSTAAGTASIAPTLSGAPSTAPTSSIVSTAVPTSSVSTAGAVTPTATASTTVWPGLTPASTATAQSTPTPQTTPTAAPSPVLCDAMEEEVTNCANCQGAYNYDTCTCRYGTIAITSEVLNCMSGVIERWKANHPEVYYTVDGCVMRAWDLAREISSSCCGYEPNEIWVTGLLCPDPNTTWAMHTTLCFHDNNNKLWVIDPALTGTGYVSYEQWIAACTASAGRADKCDITKCQVVSPIVPPSTSTYPPVSSNQRRCYYRCYGSYAHGDIDYPGCLRCEQECENKGLARLPYYWAGCSKVITKQTAGPTPSAAPS